jgi:hypothetical protein
MKGSVVDLIVSMLQNPQVPMRPQERLGPVSYANDDTEVVPGLHNSQDVANSMIDKVKGSSIDWNETQQYPSDRGAMPGTDVEPGKVFGGEYKDLDPYMRTMLERQDKANRLMQGKYGQGG